MSKEQDLIIKIKADTDKASKEVSTLTKDIKKLNTETKKTGSSAGDISKVSKGFSGVSKAITGLIAGLGVLGVAMKAVEFAKLAGDAEQASQAFDTIFTDLGLNAVEEFEKIKEASKGLIDEASIKQSAVTAVSLGVPIEKLAQLMEVARVKAKVMGTDVKSAFNDLAVGIGRGSPMILDNLGLTIKLGDANQQYADEIGKTVEELTKQEKQIALTNAVIVASADDMRRFGDSEKNTNERTQELQASIVDLKVKIGEALLPTMEKLTKETKKYVDGLTDADWSTFQKGVEGTVTTLGNLLKVMGFLNDIAVPDLFGYFGDKTLTNTSADVIDDIATTINVLADAIDGLINSQDELFVAQSEYEALAGSVASFTGTSEDFDKLERSMKATIDKTSALHTKWSESENPHAYKEVIVDLEETLGDLGDKYSELQNKKPFEPTITSADLAKASVDELGKAVKKYTDEEVKAIADAHKEILTSEKTKAREYLATEKQLVRDIAQAHKKLASDLKQIADERWATELSLNDRIRDINQEALSSVGSYQDREKEAQEKLSLAKEALLNNDLEKFRTYISQYESLGLELASKRIAGDKLVEDSKENTQKKSLEVLNQEKELYNQYYNQKAENAQKAHDATVAQKEAELNGTLALIEANKVLMDLLKQLIEGLTGKKITLDTSAVDALTHKVKGAQGYINYLTENQNEIKIGTTQVDVATQKVEQLKTLTINGVTLEVKADTTPADFDVRKLINTYDADGNLISIEVNAEWQKAHDLIEKKKKEEERVPIEKPVEIDTKSTDADMDKWKKDLEAIPLVKSVSVAVDEEGKFDAFVTKSQTPSTHKIDVNNSAPESAIASNQVDTWSTHTIYVKEVPAKSGGGSVPQRLASGGTFSGSGRVGGYDPFDTDSVNAFLTGGEFVIKRSAVDLYGTSFLNALNNMSLPKIKGYASGGVVGNTSNTNQNLRPVQLNIGGNSFEMLSPNEVAHALQTYIENEGGL